MRPVRYLEVANDHFLMAPRQVETNTAKKISNNEFDFIFSDSSATFMG